MCIRDRSDNDLKAVIQERINDYNAAQPTHKRINRVKIRKTEFEKTTTMKIKRYKMCIRDRCSGASGGNLPNHSAVCVDGFCRGVGSPLPGPSPHRLP